MPIRAVISVSTLGFSSELRSSFSYCPLEKFQIFTEPSAEEVTSLRPFISKVPVVSLGSVFSIILLDGYVQVWNFDISLPFSISQTEMKPLSSPDTTASN